MEIIVEIAQAHDGSYGSLLAMVDKLCSMPIDTIKLQHHIADSESSCQEQFRKVFTIQDKSRFDYWKRMELPVVLLRDIKAQVEASEKNFLCTPFSLRAVDELESIGVSRYKIGSADIDNQLLIKRIAETEKPVILSTGIRDYFALESAIEIFYENKNDITLMHCTSSYPTPLESINLGMIDSLRSRYGLKVGLSDHSGSVWPSIFAISHGVSCVEIHFAWSRDQFGPDASSSLTPNEIELVAEAVSSWKKTHSSLSEPAVLEQIERVKRVFNRSVKLRASVKKNEPLSLSHLETFKPGDIGVSPIFVMPYLGCSSNRDIQNETVLTEKILREAFNA